MFIAGSSMGNRETNQHRRNIVTTTIEPLTRPTFSYESSSWIDEDNLRNPWKSCHMILCITFCCNYERELFVIQNCHLFSSGNYLCHFHMICLLLTIESHTESLWNRNIALNLIVNKTFTISSVTLPLYYSL